VYTYAKSVIGGFRYESFFWPSNDKLTQVLETAFRDINIPLTVSLFNMLLQQSLQAKDNVTSTALMYILFPEMRFTRSKPVEVAVPSTQTETDDEAASRKVLIEPNAYSFSTVLQEPQSYVTIKSVHSSAKRLMSDNPYVLAHFALAYVASGNPSHAVELLARSERILKSSSVLDDSLRRKVDALYTDKRSQIHTHQVAAGLVKLGSIKDILYQTK